MLAKLTTGGAGARWYLRVFVCVCTYTRSSIHTSVCTHVQFQTHIRAYMHTQNWLTHRTEHTWTQHSHIHACTLVRTLMHTFPCEFVHTHTHIHTITAHILTAYTHGHLCIQLQHACLPPSHRTFIHTKAHSETNTNPTACMHHILHSNPSWHAMPAHTHCNTRGSCLTTKSPPCMKK